MYTKQEQLSLLTTIHIGGITTVIYPETLDELASLYTPHILGNGSNLLVHNTPNVVISTKALSAYNHNGNIFDVQCGVMMPVFVREAAKLGYGGLSFLASVPGTLGGCIYMNAGGGVGREAISDVVQKVEVSYNNKRFWLTKKECGFAFRHSIFHENKHTILRAILCLPPYVPNSIEKRMELVRQHHDSSYPNAGSVFKTTSGLQQVMGKACGGARWSPKTINRLQNYDKATAQDMLTLISEFPEHELEWIVW